MNYLAGCPADRFRAAQRTKLLKVLVDGEQIGNVPRGRVAEILAVLDRIEDARLEVETFRPEEEDDEGKTRRGELIYRADLYLTYTK